MFNKALLFVIFTLTLSFSQVLNLNEAFDIKHKIDNSGVEFSFGLGENIFIYKDTFKLKLGNKDVTNLLNQPKAKNSNGHQIFMENFILFVPINLIKDYMDKGINELNLEYQGCSENGICYRPQFKKFTISKSLNSVSLKEIDLQSKDEEETELSDEQSIALNISNQNFFISLLTFLGFGLLLSLTPCVFPMIPILSSIIIAKRSENLKAKQGFLLSFVYVFAMSLAYAIAGILASVLGSGIQGALQNPYVLGVFSLIFVLLAFSMFGFYEIKMPSKLENLVNKKGKDSSGYIGVFIMGFTSALIVSPCVAAPLAGALLYISQSGNLIYGGVMLFVMGLGMGVPLLLIGISSGKILPKPGIWMDSIKISFGFLMILMAIWLISRVFASGVELISYGIVGVFWAVYLGAFESANNGGIKFKKAIAILLFIYSVMLILGGFLGSRNLLSPFEEIKFQSNYTQNELKFQKITNLDNLNEIIRNSKKPVLVDFWASWCASCLELDNKTFNNESVKNKLQNFTIVKIDVTKSNSQNRAMLQNFSLIDPPALLIFQNGSELSSKRIIGYISPENFLQKIENIF